MPDVAKYRTLQLLAQKREEKSREESEKAKREEVERRKLGQDVSKLRQWKEERERKEFENSYKKQKEEDRLAREKVRADLERDRSAMWNIFLALFSEYLYLFYSDHFLALFSDQCIFYNVVTLQFASRLYTVNHKKRWQYICHHNSGKSSMILITFTYL